MADGNINGQTYQAPHCDDKVLHAPGKCDVCDAFPNAQQERIRNNINFTGEGNPNKAQCPAEARRKVGIIHQWYGNTPHRSTDPDQNVWGFLDSLDSNIDDEGFVPAYNPSRLPKKVCTCIAGRSRFCEVHGDDDGS